VNALSLAYSDESIRSAAENLKFLDSRLSEPDEEPALRLQKLEALSPFRFSPLAKFIAATPAAYENEIALILRSFVEPEPALKMAPKGKVTALTVALRKTFREDRVLAAKGEDLSAHRIVPNVELAAGMVADFVLKNGAMHIFETVDASSEGLTPLSIAKSVGLSAITIEQARINYGDAVTVARLIYQATAQTETLITPALLAAEHQGAELINWSSSEDQRRLRVTIADLAVPLPKRGEGRGPVNASTQHRFALN
jgi:hypothetical protein